MLLWLFFISLFSVGGSVPLAPGQPGGPWSSEEIDIVRDKVSMSLNIQ